jgi:hypothetical protein
VAHNLIAGDRVEGTVVYRPFGEKIGVIQRLMIDKVSGKVAYAVLTFGGFLSFGQKHYPVPWAAFTTFCEKPTRSTLPTTNFAMRRSTSVIRNSTGGDRSGELGVHKVYRTTHYWE